MSKASAASNQQGPRYRLSHADAIKIHEALHDVNRNAVILSNGDKRPIHRTKDNLRKLSVFDFPVVQQNPTKANSEYARRAQLGSKITWFMTSQKAWGCIEDGKIVKNCWLFDPTETSPLEEYEPPQPGPKDDPHDDGDHSAMPPAKRRKIEGAAEDQPHDTDAQTLLEPKTEPSTNFKKTPSAAAPSAAAADENAFPEPADSDSPHFASGEPPAAPAATAATPAAPEDPRPLCKYGASCYRKNPDHFKEFRHPDKEKTGEKSFSSSAKLPSTVPVIAKKASSSALGQAAEKKNQSHQHHHGPKIVDDELADDALSDHHPAAAKKANSNSKKAYEDNDDDSNLFPTPASPVKSATPTPTPASKPVDSGSGPGSGSGSGSAGSSGASAPLLNWEINYEDIEMGPKLGSGAFGEVRIGTWMGTDVAVKVLHANDDKARDTFYKEANLICQLRHPNIVPFLGVCLKDPLAIVMELMPSSLTKLIKQGPMEVSLLKRLASGIVRGILFLHKSNPKIIHRDLKPDNILLDHSNNPKLADFGVSREKISTQEMTRIGTPSYCAPEILKGEKYSEKVDIFSFGMILYAMTTGRPPFRGDPAKGEPALSPLQIMMKIAVQKERPVIPPEVKCPDWLNQLISECWDANPDKRPTADEILKRLVAAK